MRMVPFEFGFSVRKPRCGLEPRNVDSLDFSSSRRRSFKPDTHAPTIFRDKFYSRTLKS